MDILVIFLGAVAATLLAPAPSATASIPAWLDPAIGDWNKANPERTIDFVDVKDSFVWYRLPRAGDCGSAEIRDRVYGIARKSGYKKIAGEDLITAAPPPSRCARRWRRRH